MAVSVGSGGRQASRGATATPTPKPESAIGLQKHPTRKAEVIEGDLIDFSDEMTIKDYKPPPESISETAKMLQELDISEHNQDTSKGKATSSDGTANESNMLTSTSAECQRRRHVRFTWQVLNSG